MKRISNDRKRYNTKATISKHRKCVDRAKMRKTIAKITRDIRMGNWPMKGVRDVAQYTNNISEYVCPNAIKALQRVSNYARIFK